MIRARLNRGGWKAVLGFDVERTESGVATPSTLAQLVIDNATLPYDAASIGLPGVQLLIASSIDTTQVGRKEQAAYVLIPKIDLLRLATGAVIELDAAPLGFNDGTRVMLLAGLNDQVMTRRLMEGDLRADAWVQ